MGFFFQTLRGAPYIQVHCTAWNLQVSLNYYFSRLFKERCSWQKRKYPLSSFKPRMCCQPLSLRTSNTSSLPSPACHAACLCWRQGQPIAERAWSKLISGGNSTTMMLELFGPVCRNCRWPLFNPLQNPLLRWTLAGLMSRWVDEFGCMLFCVTVQLILFLVFSLFSLSEWKWVWLESLVPCICSFYFVVIVVKHNTNIDIY